MTPNPFTLPSPSKTAALVAKTNSPATNPANPAYRLRSRGQDDEDFFLRRFASSFPHDVRALLYLKYGRPMGSFDPTEDTEIRRQRVNEEAHRLADLGYPIDAAIMSEGGDDSQGSPLAIMSIRKQQGFTWVPNAKQANIPVMPGLNFPGLPSYDPDHPPAGSILVSTDPEFYKPWPDMVATSKPFLWRNMPPQSYLDGFSTDIDGVGAFYESNGERYDIGARWGDAETGRLYEKTPFVHRFGSTEGWERIA